MSLSVVSSQEDPCSRGHSLNPRQMAVQFVTLFVSGVWLTTTVNKLNEFQIIKCIEIDCSIMNLLRKSINKSFSNDFEIRTYPADCRKIAAIDSNKHDWD